MPDPSPPAKSAYRFENDVTGRLFRWLIESGQVDWPALVDEARREEADPQEVVRRLAKALKRAVGEQGELAAERQQPPPGQGSAAGPRTVAPAYSIWFRPSPSKKIKFKEVAEALLVFAGWRSAQE
ncbi:MAG: hypothetical protein ABSG86_05090 [Thermoguttaceae bacterium]|jgi:hypothetical protein